VNTFKKIAAQGEITVTRIEKIPEGLVPVKAENGIFIIGHSETGHHHVLTMDRAKVFRNPNPPAGMNVLYAILDEPKELTHQRDFDTHKPVALQPGSYEFISGREFDHYAELSRTQAD
jgi:hypothetical protein